MRCSNWRDEIAMTSAETRTWAEAERHLADDLAGTATRQHHVVPVPFDDDLDLARLDQIGAISSIALGKKTRPRRQKHAVRRRAHRLLRRTQCLGGLNRRSKSDPSS